MPKNTKRASLLQKPKSKTQKKDLKSTVEQVIDEVSVPMDETKVDPRLEEKLRLSPLVSRIHENIAEAERSRLPVENQWIKNLKAYRAEDSNMGDKNNGQSMFRESEIHKPYIRTTTVKTRAAYSQIMEAIMQNSRFPLMIEPTPVPEGVPEYITNDPNAGGPDTQEDFGIGFEGDGRELAPGATAGNMSWKEDEQIYAGMNEGRDKSGGQFVQMSPARRAAEKFTKILQDQLEESNAHTELRSTVFEACLLGTGIMKGVFTEEKTIHKWTDGKYAPEYKKFPKLHNVSAWDLYIDPNAMSIEEAEWIIERHRMTAKDLRDLKSKAFYNHAAINAVLAGGGNYTDKSFEHTVRESESLANKGRLWEVLEYWGYISREEAILLGLEPQVDPLSDQVQVNLWISGDEILRVMINPFLPKKLPYFLLNYEVNPYTIYGVGVPETMEDSQKMMNGFARLAVDNLTLAGNMVFEVDESTLIPGQDMSIKPGKIFRRQGGQAGQSIHGIKFPSTANENLQMFQEFRRQADEATGIPSVSHGQTGVTGVGRTSSGLNMILENASLNIKTVIRNIDDDLLQPIGMMLFHWNNQYNPDAVPEGDMVVIPTGIRSYTKNEIKVQRIQGLMNLVANPAIAPMIKMPYLVREYVKGLDMDPNEVINDMDEARVYAEIIGAAQGNQQGGEAPTDPSQAQGLTGAQGNTEGAGNVEGFNGSEITGP